MLGKQKEKVVNWETISVRPFHYTSVQTRKELTEVKTETVDKALFAFQLPQHKGFTLEINPTVISSLPSSRLIPTSGRMNTGGPSRSA